MLKFAVCDDQSYFTNSMVSKIENHFENRLKDIEIYSYNDPKEFVVKAREIKFDVIFLDIMMPEISGIKAANLIREFDKDAILIFLTSADGYVFDGYKVNAFRYIKKGDNEELEKALFDIEALIASANLKILVKTKNDNVLISLNNIFYIEAHGRTTTVYTETSSFESTQPLGYFADRLQSNGFLMSHKGFLVNPKHIMNLNNNIIVLTNGSNIPVSRRNYQSLVSSIFSDKNILC